MWPLLPVVLESSQRADLASEAQLDLDVPVGPDELLQSADGVGGQRQLFPALDHSPAGLNSPVLRSAVTLVRATDSDLVCCLSITLALDEGLLLL